MSFFKTKQKTTIKQPALIPEGMKVVGNINCNGDIKIDGILEGNIICSGKIIISKSAKVKGNINAVTAILQGFLKGKINCSHLLSIDDHANLQGEVYYNNIKMSNGAVLVGELFKLNEDQLKKPLKNDKITGADEVNYTKYLKVVKESTEKAKKVEKKISDSEIPKDEDIKIWL